MKLAAPAVLNLDDSDTSQKRSTWSFGNISRYAASSDLKEQGERYENLPRGINVIFEASSRARGSQPRSF